MKENTYFTPYILWFLLIITTSAFGLAGCSQNFDGSMHEEAKHSLYRVKEVPGTTFFGAAIIPIQVGSQEEFYKSAGWLNDREILFISNKGESQSLLYSFNLVTGNAKLLYDSAEPIISAIPSPNRKKVLIHSGASSEGILTIIDTSGEELFTKRIESFELTFEWNPFDENLLVISSFTEEWEFTTYLLDLSDENLKQLHLPEPFIRWISKDTVVYQDWNENGLSFQAPLNSFSFKTKETEKIFENVYQFDSTSEYLVTVHVNEEDKPGWGLYSFSKNGVYSIASLEAPLLTSFSGWVVPFYDLMDSGKDFIYLRAKEQGEADLYDGGFDLMRFDLVEKKEEMIFSQLANEPLSCSPSGELCLYGFQLEKVLNIKTMEIIELVH